MKSLVDLARNAEVLVARNSPAILTAVGVAGTVFTAVLTGRGAVRAYKIAQDNRLIAMFPDVPEDLTLREQIPLVWKEFIPPALVGTGTIAAIIMANRIGARRTAAVTAAFAITERAYDEYKDKVVELHGEAKERKVRDAIAQDRIEEVAEVRELPAASDGKVLCLDAYSGRTFYSTVEEVKAAQNWVNYELLNNMHASLTDFYGRVGLARTQISDDLGWNCDRQLELDFTWGSTDDQKPCCVVTFHNRPFPNYYKLH